MFLGDNAAAQVGMSAVQEMVGGASEFAIHHGMEHVGPGAFSTAFPGYDYLFFVNLSGQTLTSPELGAGDTEELQGILTGGYLNQTAFGGPLSPAVEGLQQRTVSKCQATCSTAVR